MTLGLWMTALGVAAIALQAALIHILNRKIPSAHAQREQGEKIISQRSFKNINEVKTEFEGYFAKIRSEMNKAAWLNLALTGLIFFLFQVLFYAMQLPPPKPGAFVVPVYAVSMVLTLVVTSFGWIKILLEGSQTRLLKQEMIDKYIILGIFSPEE